MFCPNCGKELKDTSKFCTGCGAAIKRPPVVSQEPTPVETPTPAEPKLMPVTPQPPVVEPVKPVVEPDKPDNKPETPENIRSEKTNVDILDADEENFAEPELELDENTAAEQEHIENAEDDEDSWFEEENKVNKKAFVDISSNYEPKKKTASKQSKDKKEKKASTQSETQNTKGKKGIVIIIIAIVAILAVAGAIIAVVLQGDAVPIGGSFDENVDEYNNNGYSFDDLQANIIESVSYGDFDLLENCRHPYLDDIFWSVVDQSESMEYAYDYFEHLEFAVERTYSQYRYVLEDQEVTVNFDGSPEGGAVEWVKEISNSVMSETDVLALYEVIDVRFVSIVLDVELCKAVFVETPSGWYVLYGVYDSGSEDELAGVSRLEDVARVIEDYFIGNLSYEEFSMYCAPWMDEYISVLTEKIYCDSEVLEYVESCEVEISGLLDKNLQSFETKISDFTTEHIEVGILYQGSWEILNQLDIYMVETCNDIYHFVATEMYHIPVSIKYAEENESYEFNLIVVAAEDKYIILST